MSGAYLPLPVDRWTPFAGTFRFNGLDLTGADMKFEVRLYPDAPGDPLLSYGVVTENSGLRFVGLTTIDGQPVSVITLYIGSIIEGLPFPAERGDDIDLAYDLHVKPPGEGWQRALFGPFTVLSGVTKHA